MAEETAVASSVGWFEDTRSPVRRMKVSWHPDEAVVVVSLWQDERCTGTFRMAPADAPALIHLLVDSLADRPVGGPPPPMPRRGMRARLEGLWRRPSPPPPLAPVIPIRAG